MITFQISHKNQMVFESCVNIAVLNSPNINGTFQTQVSDFDITDLKKNSVYLLERFSFSCDIDEQYYQSALDVGNIPFMELHLKNSKDKLTKKRFPLISYYKNVDISLFIQSLSVDDLLQAKFSGSLIQTSDLIGLQSVSFLCSFVIFQLDNNDYNKFHREEVLKNYGSEIRR